jgi:CheY-like chemotaxis protein
MTSLDGLPSDSKVHKILVVDDERLIADTLGQILHQHGYDVATAYDGRDAVQRARFYKPDLLLTDIVMPRLGGIEAAIQIRGLCPRCKVLLISAQTGKYDPGFAFLKGMLLN